MDVHRALDDDGSSKIYNYTTLEQKHKKNRYG